MVLVEDVRKVLFLHSFDPVWKLHAPSATLTENPILVRGTPTLPSGKFHTLEHGIPPASFYTAERSGSMMAVWVWQPCCKPQCWGFGNSMTPLYQLLFAGI